MDKMDHIQYGYSKDKMTHGQMLNEDEMDQHDHNKKKMDHIPRAK